MYFAHTHVRKEMHPYPGENPYFHERIVAGNKLKVYQEKKFNLEKRFCL